ncbi:ABC transporter substrate-binding protein [Rhizobiaceae bacterium BDR2-2]|uniref:ABC transporter substrate-binding protein n=1 Tax=Ectorhizobium quercum TaxID=2965071 RepID=A0AAE3MZI6_9HYPH|nr:ABC transporter substrate-binding protein [Ectorhizobium quercum]MCX8998193.1 ABC transporter substrate-binding protein [Ectorhizobium quercum]
MTSFSSPFLTRRRLLLSASALAAAGAAGLPLSSPARAADDTPKTGGTLRIAFLRDNTTLVSLDPFQVYWLEHRVVLRNVVESLTDQDPETGEIIPWLATGWQISDDGLAYTFTLRDDVTFSNGEPFDAEAVRIALDSNKEFAQAVPATFGRTYLAGYDRSEVVDPHTIRIHLAQPNAGFLQATSTTNLSILAPESYKRTPQERSLGALVGTGPFTLESYTPEVGIRLKRREDYAWPSAAVKNRGKAWLEAVDVRYITEESVRNGQFIQGQIDLLWPRDPFAEVDLDLFKANGAQILERSLPGPALNLYPNTAEGRILSDPKVRAAFQKSIDRESYAKGIFSADFPTVQGPYDVTTPFFKSQADKLGYDPEGAAKLLDEAGWTPGDGGWRYKDGKRLTLVRPLQGAETAGDVLIQDQLRQVGIELKLEVLVAGEYQAFVSAARYDLHSSYMTRADPVVLQTILDPRYTANSALSVNAYPPETLAKAQALFDEGLRNTSREGRAEAYGALQDLLIDDNVAFPIYERLWQAAAQPGVRGFQWTSEGFALLSDIWLAADA